MVVFHGLPWRIHELKGGYQQPPSRCQQSEKLLQPSLDLIPIAPCAFFLLQKLMCRAALNLIGCTPAYSDIRSKCASEMAEKASATL